MYGLTHYTCTCTIHKYMSLNDMGKYMALNEMVKTDLYYVSWSELGGMQKKKRSKLCT